MGKDSLTGTAQSLCEKHQRETSFQFGVTTENTILSRTTEAMTVKREGKIGALLNCEKCNGLEKSSLKQVTPTSPLDR